MSSSLLGLVWRTNGPEEQRGDGDRIRYAGDRQAGSAGDGVAASRHTDGEGNDFQVGSQEETPTRRPASDAAMSRNAKSRRGWGWGSAAVSALKTASSAIERTPPQATIPNGRQRIGDGTLQGGSHVRQTHDQTRERKQSPLIGGAVPSNLELHYVTHNLIGMTQPRPKVIRSSQSLAGTSRSIDAQDFPDDEVSSSDSEHAMDGDQDNAPKDSDRTPHRDNRSTTGRNDGETPMTPGRKRRRPTVISPLEGINGEDPTSLTKGEGGSVSSDSSLKELLRSESMSQLTTDPLSDRDTESDRGPAEVKNQGGNCPATLSTFLTQRHHNQYLCFNLTDFPADEGSLLLLNNQIVNISWTPYDLAKSESDKDAELESDKDETIDFVSTDSVSSSVTSLKSSARWPSTPSLIAILDLCHAIGAYQSLSPQNVACLYCHNGKTRTGVATACYLKYSGKVSSSLDGFRLFCRRSKLDGTSAQSTGGVDVAELIPPSLLELFRNFDDMIELRTWPNAHSLYLRAVALQGVPVEDLPVLEIWDGAKGRIYSSHEEGIGETSGGKDADASCTSYGRIGPPAQWAEDRGFYLVDKALSDEFTILCRFGGKYSGDAIDQTKVLFRYANHAGFLSWGPLKLMKGEVDMRRYIDGFDDDFALSLMFERDEGSGEVLTGSSRPHFVVEGPVAFYRGVEIINSRHSWTVLDTDVIDLMPAWACDLATRLSNRNMVLAKSMLYSDRMQKMIGAASGKTPTHQLLRRLHPFVGKKIDLFEKRNARVTAAKLRLGDEAKEKSLSEQVSLGALDATIPGGRLEEGEEHSNESEANQNQMPTRETLELKETAESLIAEGSTSSLLVPFPRRYSDTGGSVAERGVTASEDDVQTVSAADATLSESMAGEETITMKKRLDAENATSSLSMSTPRCLSVADGDNIEARGEATPNNPGTDLVIAYTSSANNAGDELNDRDKTQTMKNAAAKHSLSNMISAITRKKIPDSGDNAYKGGGPAPHLRRSNEMAAELSRRTQVDDNDDEEKAKINKNVDASKDAKVGNDMRENKQNHLEPQSFDREDIAVCLDLLSKMPQSEYNIQDLVNLLAESEKAGNIDDTTAAQTKEVNDVGDKIEDTAVARTKEINDVNDESGAVILKEEPEYQKYFKMLGVGLPMGAVQNAMHRDGKDPAILELDPNKSLKSQRNEDEDDGPPLKGDEEYAKYFKMLGLGLPMGAVQNAMHRDGKDPAILELDPNKSLKSQRNEDEDEDDGPPLKEDEEYAKYFKMLGVGLPMGAVQNAMHRDGKDPAILELDPNKSLKSQRNEDEDDGPPLKGDEEYAKYFKMLGLGLPMGAVQNAMHRDGKDPAILELDPNKSLKSQQRKSSDKKKNTKKKKTIKRKKIHWNPIDKKRIHKQSLWSIISGTVNMAQLKYDASEFENLFTETMDPAEKKKKAAAKRGADRSGKPKKSVQVIEGKRGMNGGIILARLKISFDKIAKMVDLMENGDTFDATQLSALKEFLPTDDERKALQKYVDDASKKPETKEEVMADLCACEKYMVEMMGVRNAAGKFDCMLYKLQFDFRSQEIMDGVIKLNTACNEVQSSERFRKLLAIILTVGNQINTGGEGNLAAGFSLDALLKLDKAKAFDKKTSVLFYLVKIVKENDASLLKISEDVAHVSGVNGLMIDSIYGDLKQMRRELDKVITTAEEDAKSDSNEDDDEMTEMQKFAKDADEKVNEYLKTAENTKLNFGKVLLYFGEDEKMSSGAFFTTMTKFLTQLERAIEGVEDMDRQKLKEEKRIAAQKAKEKLKADSKEAKVKGSHSEKAKAPPKMQDIRAKWKKLESEREPATPKGLALAAAVALKKRKDIAATRAEVGLSKLKQKSLKDNGPNIVGIPRNPLSGIKDMDTSSPKGVAVAAAAALKKRKDIAAKNVEAGVLNLTREVSKCHDSNIGNMLFNPLSGAGNMDDASPPSATILAAAAPVPFRPQQSAPAALAQSQLKQQGGIALLPPPPQTSAEDLLDLGTIDSAPASTGPPVTNSFSAIIDAFGSSAAPTPVEPLAFAAKNAEANAFSADFDAFEAAAATGNSLAPSPMPGPVRKPVMGGSSGRGAAAINSMGTDMKFNGKSSIFTAMGSNGDFAMGMQQQQQRIQQQQIMGMGGRVMMGGSGVWGNMAMNGKTGGTFNNDTVPSSRAGMNLGVMSGYGMGMGMGINGGVNGGINQEINGQHPNASSGIPRFGMGFDGDGQQQNTSSRSSRPNSNIGSHKKRDPFDSLFDANM